MMKVIDAPTGPTKTGVLYKQGGTDGGHKNWKQRFFVLTDHLAYYPSESHYKAAMSSAAGSKPLDIVKLDAYFVAPVEGSTSFEFTVHAYPKTLVCRAKNQEEMQEWVQALMAPMRALHRSAREVKLERRALAEKIEEEAEAGVPVSGVPHVVQSSVGDMLRPMPALAAGAGPASGAGAS